MATVVIQGPVMAAQNAAEMEARRKRRRARRR